MQIVSFAIRTFFTKFSKNELHTNLRLKNLVKFVVNRIKLFYLIKKSYTKTLIYTYTTCNFSYTYNVNQPK